MKIITLGKEHKDLVIKTVKIDLKPTSVNDDPITIHHFLWTGKSWKRLAIKNIPLWANTFENHYCISNEFDFKNTYKIKGDRKLQPFQGEGKIIEPLK